MIRFTLTCDGGHRFDSWFKDGAAFDSLQDAGRISCAVCGSTIVEKSLMAPSVAKTEAVTAPAPPEETAIAKLKAEVESKADYVGKGFVKEARAMHEGRKDHRPIYGEAKPAEARKLLAEGVPVLPLPFVPSKRSN